MATLQGRDSGFPKGTADWDGRRIVRTYEDQWQVRAANESEGPKAIIETLNLRLGDTFFDDEFAYVKRVGPAVRESGNRLVWHVPVFYTTQMPIVDIDELQNDTAPEDRRLRRRWSFETLQVAATKDAVSGAALVNSVNEPLELTEDIVIPVLTVERYKQSFDHQEILDYVNHVNAAAFYSAPAKTALMAGIEAEEDALEVHNGTLYDRVRYTIKFKIPVTEDNKGWLWRIIDMGTIHRDPDDETKFVPYLSDPDVTTGDRSQITGPLDGEGNPLDVGDPLFVLPDNTGFNKHKTANFDTLAIGPTD